MGDKCAVLFGYDPSSSEILEKSLVSKGFEVKVVERLEWASSKGANVIYCALPDNLPDAEYRSLLDEIQVLRIARENLPILCTSEGKKLERIVQAVRAGASDYEAWPDLNGSIPEKLLHFAEKSLKEEVSPARGKNESGFYGILGKSIEIKKVFDMISRVSETASNILIVGESGTGKELVCRAIHKSSERRNGPLIPVNCGAIPEELLESELFGHEKGAFTGATTAREGRFQMADGGTIFLDEVSEMSPKLQVKFLRVLQESEFERVGGSRTIRVNVRVIAATNKDLERAVAQKEFREDLYYRLNVIPIHLPPLRERKGDIPVLVEAFINRFREKNMSKLEKVSETVLEALQEYPWPGNVRELENLIERMAILADNPELRLEELPERFCCLHSVDSGPMKLAEPDIPEEGIDLKAVIDDLESRLIEKALEKSGGVKNRAAQLLGLNRTTLVEKLKKKKMEEAKASE